VEPEKEDQTRSNGNKRRDTRKEKEAISTAQTRPTASPAAAAQQASKTKPHGKVVKANEKIVKVTELVERAAHSVSGCRSYVVVETEAGNLLVAEKDDAGGAKWSENPSGLECRNSVAKVIRSCECPDSGALIGEIRGAWAQELLREGSSNARYAQVVFCCASGEMQRAGLCTGFRRSNGLPFLSSSRLNSASGRAARGRFTA